MGPTLAQRSKPATANASKTSTTKVIASSTGTASTPETLEAGVGHEGEVGGSVGCETCGGRHGLHNGMATPCPWRSTCDMPLPIPYFAEWATYYYFRPYNYLDLARQRDLAASWEGDAQHPYANEMFNDIYEGLEDDVEDESDQPADTRANEDALRSLEQEIELNSDGTPREPPQLEEMPDVEVDPDTSHRSKAKAPKKSAALKSPLVHSAGPSKGGFKVITTQ